MRSRTRQRRIALALVACSLILVPATAGGDHGEVDVPWPQLLPPFAGGGQAQPHPVVNCRHARPECAGELVRRLRRQWQRFDARCDHRAVIAYSYLQITKGLRDDLALTGPADADGRPRLVRHRRWMRFVIADFSNRYFDAFRRYRHGERLAPAWRITFEAAESGDVNAGQDVLLFSNAHVQHDLPFVYAKMGQRTPAGESLKPDHDAVNAINTRVYDGIQDFIAARYDPTFTVIDASPSPAEEVLTLEGIKGWRELAWRNGERLLAADSRAERRQVAGQIRDSAALWARLIAAVEVPGQRASRDAYCAANRGS